MYRDLKLPAAAPHVGPLDFSWDQDAGKLAGRDRQKVQQLVDATVKEGSVTSHPLPTTYAITDPLHDPAQMAAILAQYWLIPADMAAYLDGADAGIDAVVVNDDGSETPVDVELLQ